LLAERDEVARADPLGPALAQSDDGGAAASAPPPPRQTRPEPAWAWDDEAARKADVAARLGAVLDPGAGAGEGAGAGAGAGARRRLPARAGLQREQAESFLE